MTRNYELKIIHNRSIKTRVIEMQEDFVYVRVE